jgi:decaprenylphospho-beta-D-ribofuranose 2-oxidase
MHTTLPYEKLTVLENFGHSLRAPSYLYKPTSVKEIARIFEFAKHNGLKVTARGAGRSYNDAALNGGGMVMDLTGMNKVLAWDPQTGVITAEPGLTIEGLWHVVLPDGGGRRSSPAP